MTMRLRRRTLGAALTLTAALMTAAAVWSGAPAAAATAVPGTCVGVPEPTEGAPAYYAIDLVSTRRLPGTRNASGVGEVTLAQSPFGVALSPAGTYRQALSVRVDGLPTADDGEYVLWVTTPQLDEIRRVGPVEMAGTVEARVDWNKFLVVVTLEPEPASGAETWEGPVVLRGMSRSGRMHTMAGHGPFQAEPCAQYGY